MDSSMRLKNEIEDLPELILDVADQNQLCLFKRTTATSIKDEAERVITSIERNHEYLAKRYEGEPIREQ